MSKLVEINWKPDEKTLRQFGVICFVALPLLGFVWSIGQWWPNPLQLSHEHLVRVGWMAGAGAALMVVGFVRPSLLKYVFIGLSVAALPIGFVVGEVMVLTIFFLVFLPVAVIFKLIGRDALDRRLDPSAATYWRPKERFTDVRRYFRQS